MKTTTNMAGEYEKLIAHKKCKVTQLSEVKINGLRGFVIIIIIIKLNRLYKTTRVGILILVTLL